jgi:SAM-dependent methyltransferase
LPYLTEASSEEKTAGEQDTNNKNSINSNPRMLLIGVGNSPFSADLYDAGWENQLNIDYSPVVIDAMRAKHQSTRPKMEWQVMDMTDMSALPNESYDVVIDKAAMDAIMTHEGDVWNPDDSVVAQARAMCQHISRILKPGGYHLHISFAQPHFRKKYLLGLHNPPNEFDILGVSPNDGTYSEEFRWSLQVETIRGDKNDGCFHHFLYIMQKSSS